jgi:hypothetical protein
MAIVLYLYAFASMVQLGVHGIEYWRLIAHKIFDDITIGGALILSISFWSLTLSMATFYVLVRSRVVGKVWFAVLWGSVVLPIAAMLLIEPFLRIKLW